MIKKIAVVGAGTMGNGISRMLEKQHCDFQLFSARQIMSGEISDTFNIVSADLIIESSSENISVKQNLLKRLSHLNSSGTIASTTSSLSISILGESMTSANRFCGIHFMNPASLIPIIEFTTTRDFPLERKTEVLQFLESINRVVFETMDNPGFVLNALLFPFLNRAIYMAESSQLEPKDIDQIILKVCGHKLGPLATLDLIGLDVSLEILTILHERDPYFNLPPAELLLKLVHENRLGKKSLAGFYTY